MQIRRALPCFAVVTALAVAGVSPANATDAADPISAIVQDIAPEVFADTAADAADGPSVGGVPSIEVRNSDVGQSTELGDIRADIPLDPSAPIVLADSDSSFGVGLPFGDEATLGGVGVDGQIHFDNLNGSSTVPVAKDDGSVQITTVIENVTAPERYAYDLDIPAGATLIAYDDGRVGILGSAGEFFGGFLPPWAKDGTGASLETRYEISGATLTQVVEHHGVKDVQYPVVADPWAGGNLLVYATVNFVSQGQRIDTKATTHGRVWNGVAILPYHLAELKQRLTPTFATYVTPTIREQFYCHVAGNLFEPGLYNMESWYRYVPWPQQLNPVDQCNPR